MRSAWCVSTTTSTTPSLALGCVGSSLEACSPPETLTSAMSCSSNPTTSPASPLATSSPESVAGPTPSPSLGGPPNDLFGRAVVPASPSRAPAKAQASTIPVISGRRGFGSSASAALQSSLEISSWPTPDAGGFNPRDEYWIQRRQEQRARRINGNGFGLTLGMAATLAGWPTPNTPSGGRSLDPAKMDATGRTADGRHTASLEHAVKFAGWTTPMARDGRSEMEQPKQRGTVGLELSKQARLAAWATPRAEDAESAGIRHSRNVADTLTAQAGIAAWATPQATDANAAGSRNTETSAAHPGQSLTDQVRGDRGTGRARSSAATGKSGSFQLNSRFSLWLQGYPITWASCGEAVTRSSRKSRPSSSARSSKRSEADE